MNMLGTGGNDVGVHSTADNGSGDMAHCLCPLLSVNMIQTLDIRGARIATHTQLSCVLKEYFIGITSELKRSIKSNLSLLCLHFTDRT